MLSFIFDFTNTMIDVVHHYEYQEQTKKNKKLLIGFSIISVIIIINLIFID